MSQPAAKLQRPLTAIFGLGKSFRDGETSVIDAGTEIGQRWDKDGFHFFHAVEYGRTATYCVKKKAELDAALMPESEGVLPS